MPAIKLVDWVGTFKETAQFQTRYRTLVEACESEGTCVLLDETTEQDKDTFPYTFYRKGNREYIFPKQRFVLPKKCEKKDIVPNEGYIGHPETAGYGIESNQQEAIYDESAVTGKLRIEYVDSGNSPGLKVFDVMGNLSIPQGVLDVMKELDPEGKTAPSE